MLISYLKRLYRVSLYQDSFWSILGTVLGKGFALIAGIFVARLLGSDSFGEYSLIKNTIISVAAFSSFGLGITATKCIAEYYGKDHLKVAEILKASYFITLFLSVIFSFLVFYFATPISKFLNAPHLADSVRLTAIAVIFNSLNITQISVLGGLKAYKIAARNSSISGFLTFLMTIPLVVYKGFWGAVLTLVLSAVFNCILNSFSINKLIPRVKTSFRTHSLKYVIVFSFPVAIQECLYSVTSWLVSLVFVKTAGYAELGISNAAIQWMSMIAFIPGALRNVSLSYLSSSSQEGKLFVLKRLLLINFCSTMIPCLIIWVFSDFICSFYGTQYSGMQIVLNIMVFTSVISSVTTLFTQDLLARGETWYLLFAYCTREVFTVLVSYIFMSQYNSFGALIYAIVSLIFQLVYLVLVSSRIYSLIKSNLITR